MSKKREYFKIGLGYKYAPETFYLSLLQSDGSYKRLDVDTSGYMWGYWLATGEKEKAVAEIKHFLRSRNKMQNRQITYGFYLKDSPNEYIYFNTAMTCAPEYDIAEKLSLYKHIKECFKKWGCKYHTSTTANLNGKYEVESKEDEFADIDLTRPLRLYIKFV